MSAENINQEKLQFDPNPFEKVNFNRMVTKGAVDAGKILVSNNRGYIKGAARGLIMFAGAPISQELSVNFQEIPEIPITLPVVAGAVSGAVWGIEEAFEMDHEANFGRKALAVARKTLAGFAGAYCFTHNQLNNSPTDTPAWSMEDIPGNIIQALAALDIATETSIPQLTAKLGSLLARKTSDGAHALGGAIANIGEESRKHEQEILDKVRLAKEIQRANMKPLDRKQKDFKEWQGSLQYLYNIGFDVYQTKTETKNELVDAKDKDGNPTGVTEIKKVTREVIKTDNWQDPIPDWNCLDQLKTILGKDNQLSAQELYDLQRMRYPKNKRR